MSDTNPLAGQSALPGVLGMLDNAIARIESFILAAGVLLMALNTVSNVVARFVFGESLHFSEEVNRILIVMITFAGIGYAARHGRHIRMSAFFDLVPTQARRYLMAFIAVVTGAFMFFLCYYSYTYILSIYSTGRVLPTLNYPLWTMYVWVPIGLAVTGIQYELTAIKNLTAKKVYLSTSVKDGFDEPEQAIKEQE